MNITYTQNGDYLIPNIVIRKTKPLGHYGRLRKAYLEMHRPILFNELVLSDKLFEHCAEIDETARNRMELIVRSLWCCTIKVDIENSKGQYIEKDKQEATKDGSESTKIQHGI